MPAATASHGSCLRLGTTTLAPMPARHSTMARPMPLLDPVTTATLPARSNGLDMLLLPVAARHCEEPEGRRSNPGAGARCPGLLRRFAPRKDAFDALPAYMRPL